MDIEAELEDHKLRWEDTNYESLTAQIRVKDTMAECVNVLSDSSLGACNLTTPGSVMISGFDIVGYLKAKAVPTTFEEWVIGKGGKGGLNHNLLAVSEIIDGYIHAKELGFTVTLINASTTIDYYLGVP